MLKKCLFPVAGYGTRFLPATKAMPKEMLPILDKPLIQYGVEEAAEAGLDRICFVTGRGKRAIEDHFDVSFELESSIAGTGKEAALQGIRKLIDQCSFSYTRQREMLGLGHAIHTGRRIVGEEAFGVVLADDLCLTENEVGVMSQMAALYEQYNCSVVAIEEVPDDQVDRYGVIAGEPLSDNVLQITDMVEKPPIDEAPSNLAIIGRYILTPDIFDILETLPPGRNGEVQITDALMQQAKQGRVLAYKFKGRRIDCGSVEGFVEATNYCFERSREEA
ncbi:MAG: UTP--glucose-1-phosphate uridylyltransferase GalU [Proteobacteria bacterium]|nr:UTP--glucose-1-phosphate uridylyltransferase GalU [Pseudomonadota bacterium]